MSLIWNLTIEIFVLMGIGFAAKKLGLVDETCKEKLSDLLVNLLLPASMIASSQQAFAWEKLRGAGEIAVIAAVYYLLIFLIGKALGKAAHFPTSKSAVFTLLIGFANTGFIGIPLLTQLLGGSGTLYGAIYNSVFDLFYFSYGMYLLRRGEKEKFRLRGMVSSPIIWIAVATVVIYVLPWRFPAAVTEALSMLGDAMMPVSMLVIGAELAGMRAKTILLDRSAYGVTLLRMFLFPAATLLVMLLLGADHEVAVTAVILSAMPSGTLNVIMAQKYHSHPDFATAAVMQNTLAMLVTLPVFLLLCETLL